MNLLTRSPFASDKHWKFNELHGRSITSWIYSRDASKRFANNAPEDRRSHSGELEDDQAPEEN